MIKAVNLSESRMKSWGRFLKSVAGVCCYLTAIWSTAFSAVEAGRSVQDEVEAFQKGSSSIFEDYHRFVEKTNNLKRQLEEQEQELMKQADSNTKAVPMQEIKDYYEKRAQYREELLKNQKEAGRALQEFGQYQEEFEKKLEDVLSKP